MSTTFEETMSTSSTGYFCNLCKLDFTTKEELREHTWTILHHGKLNKSKGRDCVHECSLCNETFVELLLFTKHLHGDSHQDRYNTWKKEQSVNHQTRSYSPIDAASNQSITFRSKLSARNTRQNQWNVRAMPDRPNSRNRNRNRNKRHNREPELPFQLNTFPVENSGTMTELGDTNNANSQVNFANERKSNICDRIKTRGSNSQIKANEKLNTRGRNQWNQPRGDPTGREHNDNSRKSRQYRAAKRIVKKNRSSRGSSTSLDNSLSIVNCGLSSIDLSNSIDRSRSLTPLMNVSVSSEYSGLQSGKDRGGTTPPLVTEPNRNTGNEETLSRNLRSRSKYVWFSESYRSTLGGKVIPTNTQETNSTITTCYKTSQERDVRGVNHSIVGKGADEIEVGTSTETLGHDNGNPQDPYTEMTSRVPYVNQSEREANAKVPFVSKRRTRSSYAKENSKDSDMTMDNEAGTSTKSHFLLESNNNSTTNDPKSTHGKEPNVLKTNSRLRSRSSSDDTALLSHSLRSSAIVTQYQPFDRTPLVGTLEFKSTKSALNHKDTYPTEISSQYSDKERASVLAKTNKDNTGSDGKHVDSGRDEETIEGKQGLTGEKEDNTQCTFIHIDGVRCSAKTSERLCSYHKRFPQGNLIKSEPVDEHPVSTSLLSLDLSTTTIAQDNMSFNQQYHGTENRQGEHERNTTGDKVQMMDLSASTNFLPLPHSHMGMQSQHSSSSLYQEWLDKHPRAREESSASWTRTTSSIILPASPRADNKQSFALHVKNTTPPQWSPKDHNDKPFRAKQEPVSPTSTPPSSYRDAAGSVPNLDLSRLNLPPNMRRALAMKYATKKAGETAPTATNVVPNLGTSRNRFVEAKKEMSSLENPLLEQPPSIPYKSLGPPPNVLRAARIRQQRSISLDSYPSNIGPSMYDRPGGLVPSHESFPSSMYSRVAPRSPLFKVGNAFSIPVSKHSTSPEKPKMIDLNSAAYLPSRHATISKMNANNQERNTAAVRLEQHGMTELGRTAIDKEALVSKFSVPDLRTKMRTMSTERDSAFYKEDNAVYNPTSKAYSSITVPERRPNSAERDGRYIVLESLPATTTTHTGIYLQDRPPIPAPKLRTYGDSKDGNGFRPPALQPLGQRSTEERGRQATAIALESHFRQSLHQRDRSVGGVSRLQEHGLMDLGLSTVDTQRKSASPRDLYPVSTQKSVFNPSKPHVSTHPTLPVTTSFQDSVAQSDEQTSKRKGEDISEPEQKRRKGFESSTSSQPVSYLPGFEVQELLRLEHQEQNQLKSLHEVRDQIKGTRIKLQALTIELETLQAKEKKISGEISQTKNKRVEILQVALHRSSSPADKSSSSGPHPPSSTSSVYTNASSCDTHSTTSVQSTNNYNKVSSQNNTTERSIPETNTLTTDLNTKNVDSGNGSYSSTQSELSKTLTAITNELTAAIDSPVKVKMEVDEESDPRPLCSSSDMNVLSSDVPNTNEGQGNQTAEETNKITSDVSSKDQPTQDEHPKEGKHFEQSKKDFLNKIKKQLSTPKKRQQMTKKQHKKFSEAKVSNSIALSKDKILLVREKMRGWKVQQDGIESDNPSTNVDTTSLEPNQDIPSTSTTYKETTLTPSKIPVRDVCEGSKPEEQHKKLKKSSSSGSKADAKSKTKLKVVSKKGLSHNAKSQLKKKRKSSHPSKRETLPTSSPQLRREEDDKEELQPSTTNVETDEPQSSTQVHLAAVESLKQKLKKSNSGSKPSSTSKARASSFEGHSGAVCALKCDEPSHQTLSCSNNLAS